MKEWPKYTLCMQRQLTKWPHFCGLCCICASDATSLEAELGSLAPDTFGASVTRTLIWVPGVKDKLFTTHWQRQRSVHNSLVKVLYNGHDEYHGHGMLGYFGHGVLGIKLTIQHPTISSDCLLVAAATSAYCKHYSQGEVYSSYGWQDDDTSTCG